MMRELPSLRVLLPRAEWQIDVTFDRNCPDDYKNRVAFISYDDQPAVYLTCEKACGSFSFEVNGHMAHLEIPAEGETRKADISSLIQNGLNTIEISDLSFGRLRLCIPYPTIIKGTAEETGIPEGALDLIDRIISADIRHGFCAAQLAVIKDGRLILSKAWGNVRAYNEKGEPVSGKPVTADTLFDLASNTKPYSVNYAMQYLYTQNRIDLNTPVEEIIGEKFVEDTLLIEYQGREKADLKTRKKWKKELTLRHLLMHQGGFPAAPHYYDEHYDLCSQSSDPKKQSVIYAGSSCDKDIRKKTLDMICRTPQMYEPGTGTLYSDVDYMLLCYCLEKITGKRLDVWLDEKFFRPLGLKHICYNPQEHGFLKENCAATELMGNTRMDRLHYKGIRNYTLQGEVHDPNAFYCMEGISGHAGLFSNAEDLAKLAFLMLSGGYGDRRFFSPEAIRLFTTASDPASDYASGWWVQGSHNWDMYFGSASDPSVFGHQGFTGTLSVIDPKNQMVIVLLTNRIHSTMRMEDETLGKYDGNFYTTGMLGFVSEILQTALKYPSDRKVYLSLLKNMIRDTKIKMTEEQIKDEDHPRRKAYRALCEVLEQMNHE